MYRALSRLCLLTDKQTPPTYQGTAALRKAAEPISKQCAWTQVSSGICTRNGPDTLEILPLAIHWHVLVYRPELDHLDGPTTIIGTMGETCTVFFPPPSCSKEIWLIVLSRFIPKTEENGHSPTTSYGSREGKLQNLTLKIRFESIFPMTRYTASI